MTDKQWYDDQQIDIMLKHYSQGKYEVKPGISNKNDEALVASVSDAIHEMNNKGTNTIVIPVNTANKLGSTHWTGLILKKNDKNIIEATYVDSFGSSMRDRFPKLRQTLLNNDVKAENIHDPKIIQQNNGYDCGAWTVVNANAIALGEKLYDPLSKKNVIEAPDIKGQRQKLAELMKMENVIVEPNTKFQDVASKISTVIAATRYELEKIKKNVAPAIKNIKSHLPHRINLKKQTDKELKR